MSRKKSKVKENGERIIQFSNAFINKKESEKNYDMKRFKTR